jgi:hypothetical protein
MIMNRKSGEKVGSTVVAHRLVRITEIRDPLL